VLAVEQVDENGCSWRFGVVVERKNMCPVIYKDDTIYKVIYN